MARSIQNACNARYQLLLAKQEEMKKTQKPESPGVSLTRYSLIWCHVCKAVTRVKLPKLSYSPFDTVNSSHELLFVKLILHFRIYFVAKKRLLGSNKWPIKAIHNQLL